MLVAQPAPSLPSLLAPPSAAEAIIDIATLTGACMIALGDGMAGVWSPSDTMAESVLAASKQAGEHTGLGGWHVQAQPPPLPPRLLAGSFQLACASHASLLPADASPACVPPPPPLPAGEKAWRMPLEESYRDQLKSSVADMRNTGGRLGGAITAALFLKEFVDTDKASAPRPLRTVLGSHGSTERCLPATPACGACRPAGSRALPAPSAWQPPRRCPLQVEWSHIDAAGPVWRDADGGATGYGAQLLAEWCVAQGKDEA
jgi:hypothetical protein